MSQERLVTEIRDLFEEVARLSAALVVWDGGSPSRTDLESMIAAAEARVVSIEHEIRS
jgi:hypothetical protein